MTEYEKQMLKLMRDLIDEIEFLYKEVAEIKSKIDKP